MYIFELQTLLLSTCYQPKPFGGHRCHTSPTSLVGKLVMGLLENAVTLFSLLTGKNQNKICLK